MDTSHPEIRVAQSLLGERYKYWLQFQVKIEHKSEILSDYNGTSNPTVASRTLANLVISGYWPH